MRRWPVALIMATVLALPSSVMVAQEESEKIYLDEEYEDRDRWSIGISLGLVELGDNVVEGQRIVSDDDVEPYFSLSVRIPFGDRTANYGSSRGGFQGYLEPELGYWDGDVGSDMLLGLNIIGGMPFNAVEFFLGGGIGVHFLDQELGISGLDDDSDSALGVNAQFGVDVSVNDHVALFGVGRFDLVDDDRDELEGKASVGLRIRF